MKRHGTLELDPLPSASSEDPLNSPTWKKNTNMMMVPFHAMMCTLSAPVHAASTTTRTSPAPTIKGEAQVTPTSFLENFRTRRINPISFTWTSWISFIILAVNPSITIPAVAYALVFFYANIAIVMMPAASLGLQYIAIIIGSVIGELVSGPLSDWFLTKDSARAGDRAPAQRLWLSYPGFITVIVRLMVSGVQLQNAEYGAWNVAPMIGAAIASFGNQIITTTLITFAVDNCPQRSSEVGLYINFLRQIRGFVGPFYTPLMFETINFAATAGVYCATIGGAGWIPVGILHYLRRTREVFKEADA